MTTPVPSRPSANPLTRGATAALLAAVAFGLATPFIQRFSKGVGVFPAAAMLYAGAALASLRMQQRGSQPPEATVGSSHVPRLLGMALFGAVLAPVCLIWGLQRTDAVSASLLLNFEAAFTVLLSWALYREPVGQRVVLALSAMLVGGIVLAFAGVPMTPGFGLGAFAIVLATLAWGLDNTLSRPLSELNPTRVVLWKGGLGALLSVLLALVFGQRFPSPWPLLGLLVCGATGYGLSLQLYLRAQRYIGAARTGSIFAVAPFVGALAGWLLVGAPVGVLSAVAGVFFALGVYLHLTEGHGHPHTHESVTHEHSHRHDDGHHDHHHHPPVQGEHSHVHAHEEQTHEHAHAPDIHHQHKH